MFATSTARPRPKSGQVPPGVERRQILGVLIKGEAALCDMMHLF